MYVIGVKDYLKEGLNLSPTDSPLYNSAWESDIFSVNLNLDKTDCNYLHIIM